MANWNLSGHPQPPQPQYAPQSQQIPPLSGPLNYGDPRAAYAHSQHQPPPGGPSGYSIQEVQILEDLIRVVQTNEILYDITRPSKKSGFSMSGKTPALVIGRSDAEHPIGTVRAHSMSTDVDLTIHGCATTIKTEPLLGKKWHYASVSGPGATFLWSGEGGLGFGLGGGGGALTLKDAKHDGQVIARMKGNILTFDMPGLSQAMMDEVMVSAVGMREAMRSKDKQLEGVLEVVQSLLGG